MFVNSTLIYFAFPKCASEWMRYQLGLEWNDLHDIHDWSKCDLHYCHVQPQRFIRECGVRDDATLITIVRNTYDRLASAYAYGSAKSLAYATGTFREFIERIHAHRHDLASLPMAWMYLPVNEFFGDLTERIKFFQMDNLGELAHFLQGQGVRPQIDTGYKINQTPRDNHGCVYDEDMVRMVQEVYAYELQTFGYGYGCG